MVSRLVRGGNLKLTGGGDLSRVWEREARGSGETEVFVCILSRRGIILLDVGAQMGEEGKGEVVLLTGVALVGD